MKVLIVSQYFWPENFRVNELSTSLADRGHAVTVLTSVPNYPEGRIKAEFAADPSSFDRLGDVEIVRVPQLVRGTGKIRLALNYLSFALAASLLGPWRLRGCRFDVIFVFQTSPVTVGVPGAVMARVKRAPLLMWILDCWPETLTAIGVGGPGVHRAIGRLVRWIYARCDLLLGQSRGFVSNVARYGDARRFRHFPNWVEAEYRDAPALVHSRGVKPFAVVYAGNVGEAQDFAVVVNAAAQLEGAEVVFRIIGDGRDLDRLRADVRARGLDAMFDFAGRFPASAMPPLLAQADALLVSLRRDPLFAMTVPGKVQTYLAAGRPIIAMLDGEGADVVRESGAGVVAPAGDAEALAAAVRDVMRLTPEARAEMGARGRAYAERHYTLPALLDSLEGWFAEAITARRLVG